MAFLQKTERGTYRLGHNYRVAFNPKNPPKNSKGEILVAVKLALAKGTNYYYKAKWKVLKTTKLDEAEKIKRDFERDQEGKGTQTSVDDILFKDAVAKVLPMLTGKNDFESKNRHLIEEFERTFGNKYLERIKTPDIQDYIAKELNKGRKGATVKRKINQLGSLYKLFREHGIYSEGAPTVGVKVPNATSQPREITLENDQQRALLKACFDPKLFEIYSQCIDEAKAQVAKLPKARLDARFENSELLLKKAFVLFEAREKEVMALGYDQDLKRIFDHAASQNHGRTLDPETLYDIVLFELTYGLRKGEIVGVGHTEDGQTVRRLGLRVGHWDSAKSTLTVMRTKLKEKGGVKRSCWIVTPAIADMLNKRCVGKKPDDLIFDNSGLQINDFAHCYDEAVAFAGIRVQVVNDKGMKELIRPQFRDLRHVSANNLLDSGLKVEEVARILGHTSTIMVQKVYANRLKESTQQNHADLVSDGMSRILGV
jgi:integrase